MATEHPARIARLACATALGITAIACAAPVAAPQGGAPSEVEVVQNHDDAASDQRPARITIVPDDYHVPYAGTAADGRKFFLSDELFDFGTSDEPAKAYVGVFLWKADGTFDELRVDAVPRRADLPPGQAGASGADDVVARRLGELGEYVLEPIEVEPFTRVVDGVTFGWVGEEFEGLYSIHIEPGNFIAYYAPWDGLDYDT